MHHFPLCFQFSPPDPKYRFKYRQNAPFTVAVSIFSAFPNRLKYCHKAPFTSLVFIIYLFFAAVQNIINTTSVHALKTISMNNISLQYQIFSNTDRMHAYSETFSKFTVQYKSFKYHHDACFRNIVFIYFPAVPNNFQYHQNACFKMFSAVSNRFK